MGFFTVTSIESRWTIEVIRHMPTLCKSNLYIVHIQTITMEMAFVDDQTLWYETYLSLYFEITAFEVEPLSS